MAPVVVLSERIAPLTEWELTIPDRVPSSVVCRPLETLAEIVENARDARVVIIGAAEPFDERALSSLPRLRLVARRGVGIDNVDVEAATRHGILVTNVPDASVEEVSDHALALVLTLSRRIVPALHAVDRFRIDRARAAVDGGPRLSESTLGVVGCGRIGRRLVAKAGSLFARVLVADPYVDAVDGAEVLPLQEMVSCAHAISIHVPLTIETRGLFDAKLLAATRNGVLVVNTARAGVVDEVGLADRVREGLVGGVGLDVTDHERMWRELIADGFDNVLLTGHTGARGIRAQEQLRRTCADQVVDYLSGRPPGHLLNAELIVDAEGNR